jgi:phosphoglycerol transferase MdoB-like AlkP superfamily enzyme
MINPIEIVQTPIEDIVDEDKFDYLKKQLLPGNTPLFVHLHYMGTHGSAFHPEKQVFSAGQDIASQEAWSVDFYDDAILQFDEFVQRVIMQLKAKGLYDNTILIVGSDHAEKYSSTQRIPLLIHFPGGKYAGTIHNNVQNLDVAPTLLEYLGIKKPVWMEGVSLLQGEPPQRPIFSVDSAGKVIESNNTWILNPEALQAPFYNLGHINVVYCQNWYQINLMNYQYATAEVPGSTDRCADSEIPSREQVYGWIIAHFEANGYDASALK